MRGFSLPEALLSGALLSILTAVLSVAWIQGARTWNYASRLSERVSQMTAVRHRIEKELLNSNTLTVTVAPDALAFATALSDAEHYVLEAGQPQWQRTLLYYRAGDTLMGAEAPYADGPLDLAPLRTGGKVLVEHVSDFQVKREANLVHFELECSQVFYSDRERRVRLSSTTMVRN